jgi:UDP-perosamine 4-acetyltransferase
VLFGGGTHCHMIIDLIRHGTDYEIYGILDDKLKIGSKVMSALVIGGSGELQRVRDAGVAAAANCVGGVKNLLVRQDVSRVLEDAGFELPTLIHRRAIVEPTAEIAPNVQILGGAYVGSQAHIGGGVIVGTLAVVSHDTVVGEGTHISPGAMIAGQVKIGRSVQIGMGVAINADVTVGDRAQIGNGAIVHTDIPAGAIVRTTASWGEGQL